MRFLKYGPKQYFRPLFDGQFQVLYGYDAPLFRLHLDLNGAEEDDMIRDEKESQLRWGATKFHSDDEMHHVDIMPRVGRY